MEAFTKLEAARNYVTESFDEKEETLIISDKLNDSMGVNMDEILEKGYMPNRFDQKKVTEIINIKKD